MEDPLDWIIERYGRDSCLSQEIAAEERKREAMENLRELESRILAAADAQGANASEHLREVAGQIRDHRASGHYTTHGPLI